MSPFHRPPVRTLLAAVLVALAMLLASCSGGGSGDAIATADSPQRPVGPTTTTAPPSADSGFPASWTPPPLEWTECDGLLGRRADCASLPVPVDWSDPSGPTIDLALARKPARGDRIGSLLMNPGGPGASGLEYLSYSPVSSDLAERFDQVAWDPRGVGESAGLTCDDSVPAFLAEDPSPDDAAEADSLASAADEVAADCAEEDPLLLANMATADVVRDMEAIRLALGGEPMNYLGFSYGTALGLLYAEWFGDRVRAMTLDGVVDPSMTFEEMHRGQVEGFQAAFDAAVQECDRAGEDTCGVADMRAAVTELAGQIDAQPLPGGARDVGPAEFATAIAFTGYVTDGWQALGQALALAQEGDGSYLWDLAASYYDFGGYSSYAAVVCTDRRPPQGHDEFDAYAARLGQTSPLFGPTIANEMRPCAVWPAPATGEPMTVTAPAAPPILVVGNTGDPATPLVNAESVAENLDQGVLVTVDMDGHTAYGSNDCVTRIIDDYFVDLTVPPDGTAC